MPEPNTARSQACYTIDGLLSRIVLAKQLLTLQQLSLPSYDAKLNPSLQHLGNLIAELQLLRENAMAPASRHLQATSIALQAIQSTHCSLSSIASQHNNSSPDFNQQVQLCQQRLQQIASSNAAETSAVENQHAAVAHVQTQTLTLRMKLASAALTKSNEQGTQHMAELNLRGVIDGLEVQSGLAKRELLEARQELKTVHTRVAKLQRDCEPVHSLKSQLEKHELQDALHRPETVSQMQESIGNTKDEVEELQDEIAELKEQLEASDKTGVIRAGKELHVQRTAQLKSVRDKQAQAQVYLADLDVQHQQLQEACAAQDTQDDQILLLEAKLKSCKAAHASKSSGTGHEWLISTQMSTWEAEALQMDRGEVKMTKLPVADINVACEASRPAAPTEGSHANPWEPLQKVFFPAEIEMGKTVCLPKDQPAAVRVDQHGSREPG